MMHFYLISNEICSYLLCYAMVRGFTKCLTGNEGTNKQPHLKFSIFRVKKEKPSSSPSKPLSSLYLPKHFIQMAQKSLQDFPPSETAFLFCRISSFESDNHVTLVVTVKRVTWPHPHFTDKSSDAVQLVKFFGPETMFEATNDFPCCKHLDCVYGFCLVGRKRWNKCYVSIFEDCQRHSDDDIFCG